MNYFKLFNIEEKFKINYKTLSKEFYKLQIKFHPDKNIKQSKNIKNFIQKSIIINNAYNILKNPIKRAEYIIRKNYSKKTNKYHIYDHKFLLYYFNLNNKIEETNKKFNNKKKLKKILKEIKKNKLKYYEKINIYIKKKQWKKSEKILIKLKFLQKILNKYL
ncbi:Fe-S protein assembly co-chaperone HscB [Buchnera aphidicola (Chaitoregma tattakana)]|uniref:Fe-S protein assembly co-chaperone HscB n=1 Tax=Buchnera aphidicola TaxID=9 RepID=UPI0031B80D58